MSGSMRNKRSPVLTCCPSVKLRSLMKPEIRATTSTLSIATTRPMKSPVAVTSRLTTGVTVTAGGGAPWAVAALYPVSKMHAKKKEKKRSRPASGQLVAIVSLRYKLHSQYDTIEEQTPDLFRRFQLGIQGYLRIEHLGNGTRLFGDTGQFPELRFVEVGHAGAQR